MIKIIYQVRQILDDFVVSARNCTASGLDYIAMQKLTIKLKGLLVGLNCKR